MAGDGQTRATLGSPQYFVVEYLHHANHDRRLERLEDTVMALTGGVAKLQAETTGLSERVSSLDGKVDRLTDTVSGMNERLLAIEWIGKAVVKVPAILVAILLAADALWRIVSQIIQSLL